MVIMDYSSRPGLPYPLNVHIPFSPICSHFQESFPPDIPFDKRHTLYQTARKYIRTNPLLRNCQLTHEFLTAEFRRTFVP